MKNKYFIKFFVLLVFTTLACQFLSPSETSLSGQDKYSQLRNEALNTKPEDIGIEIDENSDTPYGVIMDIWVTNEHVETLISFSNGYSNFLYSSGREGIDDIDSNSMQNDAKRLVVTSKRFVEYMKVTTEFPLPTEDNFIFYVLTTNGVYTSGEINIDDYFSNDKVSFFTLWSEAFNLISVYRNSID